MKKKNLFLGVLLSALFLLAGCRQEKDQAQFKIGINQLAEHPALDQVSQGFMDYFEDLDKDLSIDFKNAQGELSKTLEISEKFIRDDVDLIFAVATPAAQASQQATQDLPIVFSAVTDPLAAGLVKDFNLPGGNITGTSDESPIREQLELFKSLDPNIKNIGIIYNTAEENSRIQIDMATSIAAEMGLNIKTMGITSINEIAQAMDVLVKDVDGIYTITDNMVASAINLVAEKAIENKMISVGAEEAHIKGGILVTNGISYYELGRQSARMAQEILMENKDISSLSCQKSEKTYKVHNSDSLNRLGLDPKHKVFLDSEKIK